MPTFILTQTNSHAKEKQAQSALAYICISPFSQKIAYAQEEKQAQSAVAAALPLVQKATQEVLSLQKSPDKAKGQSFGLVL